MISAAEAKHLEALEKSLIKKFRAAEKEELKRRNEAVDKDKAILNVPNKPAEPPPKLRKTTREMTIEKAKQLDNLNKQLQHEFAQVHAQELEQRREGEKKYEAITKAIKEKKDLEALNEQKNNERMRKQLYNQLMKRQFNRPLSSSTPERNNIGYMGNNGDDDEEEKMEVDAVQNMSIKQLLDAKVVNLGVIGSKYLPQASDTQFGIYFDEGSERLMIGSEPITFDYNDIILSQSGKRFKGTAGLWKLLTRKGEVKSNDYSGDDWKSYKDILMSTNTLYQKNDPSSRRPKASQGQKWKKMIKPVWEKYVKNLVENVDDDTLMSGSGLREYNDQPVEYKYVKDFHELMNRLNFIYAEEMAGNNSFHNEKLSIVQFIHDRMEELVQKPNGLKYLVRCLSALPEDAIKGSGLLNDVINKLPFELHAPRNWKFDTYNFCGPGTKLNMRLERGDRGINPLDEACKQHDIWYRDHRKTADRWVADKALQKVAWDRVVSPDADLNERAVGLATTGAMWLKRKMGMGLGTSALLYKPR